MNYFLYILKSKNKETYYTGSSNDPKRRLHFHNNADNQKYTLRHRPWKLVYTHGFESREFPLFA